MVVPKSCVQWWRANGEGASQTVGAPFGSSILCIEEPPHWRDPNSPPVPLSSQLQRRLPAYDANDGAARVMLTVRLRRVGTAVSNYEAGGMNLARAADNDVVIVEWISVCHLSSL